ncbi:MAG: nucleotidyltransferase domain-containing protein [Desulfovibrionaceae bacterium]
MKSLDEIARTVTRTMETNDEIKLAFVFGSAAHGTMREDSDVDIAVDAGKPLTLDAKLDLIAALSTALHREVDLVDLQTSGNTILPQILIGGKLVLKRSSTAYAQLMKKMLFDQADMAPLRGRLIEERLQRGF